MNEEAGTSTIQWNLIVNYLFTILIEMHLPRVKCVCMLGISMLPFFLRLLDAILELFRQCCSHVMHFICHSKNTDVVQLNGKL